MCLLAVSWLSGYRSDSVFGLHDAGRNRHPKAWHVVKVIPVHVDTLTPGPGLGYDEDDKGSEGSSSGPEQEDQDAEG